MTLSSAWLSFGQWRRGRPFWAGVFLTLAGLVIIFPPFATLKVGELAISITTIGGMSGLLIGVLLVVCAATMWVRPQFRLAAGIAALLLSLVALVTTNLGGFLAGTLLGLLGSALAISWTKQTRRRRRRVIKAMPPAVVAVLLVGSFGSVPPAAHAAPVGSRAWTLTASKLSMNGLSFGGIVDSVLSGKVIKVLKFTASDLEITNLVQSGTFADGHKIVTSAAPGSTSTIRPGGRITMLTQRLKGNLDLLGIKIPIDYSADSPPPLTIPLVTFTDVTVVNTDLRGGVLTIPGARIVVS